MKILFVQLPQYMDKRFYTKRVHKRYSEGGILMPPLGMAYMASIMRKNGHDVGLIDGYAMKYDINELIERIRQENPDILMFGTVTPAFLTVVEWLKAIKQHFPNVPIILGGPHAAIFPRETLTHKVIDYVIVGEAWHTLPELLDSLKNKGDLSNVKGIGFRNGEEILITAPRERIKSWEGIPFPARDLLPNFKYTSTISKRKPVTSIITAQGCPFKCTYCAADRFVVFRDPIEVADEIEECVDKYGIKEILVYDETFTVNQARAMKICEEIIRRGINKKIVFAIRTRADCLTKELIDKIAEAGCVRINFGIETADEEALKKMKRYLPKEKIKQAVKWAQDAGIDALGFFMLGVPGETVESIKNTINFAKELNLDYVIFTKLTISPNTELFDEVQQENGIDYWRKFTLGEEVNESEVRLPSCSVPDEELDKWLEKAYRQFYFRPAYVMHRIMKLNSFAEFKELFKSALSII